MGALDASMLGSPSIDETILPAYQPALTDDEQWQLDKAKWEAREETKRKRFVKSEANKGLATTLANVVNHANKRKAVTHWHKVIQEQKQRQKEADLADEARYQKSLISRQRAVEQTLKNLEHDQYLKDMGKQLEERRRKAGGAKQAGGSSSDFFFSTRAKSDRK